jgi:hypothetical protein
MDGNGARTAMVQGWLSIMAINDGINNSDQQWLFTTAIKGVTRTAREFSFNYKDLSKDLINWLLVSI